jgi:hypothetical protein
MSSLLSHLPLGIVVPLVVLVLWLASGRNWFDIFDGSSRYSDFETNVQFNLMVVILFLLGALGLFYLATMHL